MVNFIAFYEGVANISLMHQEGATSLEQFVNELNKAWKRLSLYPEDHPERNGAMDPPLAILRGLLAATGSLALGVAQDGLTIGEEKLPSAGSTELAKALYLRNVAVLRFQADPSPRELERFLSALSSGVNESPEPFWDQLAKSGIESIRAEAVDYSSMVATDARSEMLVAEDEPEATSLWDRILQIKLAGAEPLSQGRRATLAGVIDLINQYLPRGAAGAQGSTGVAPEVAELVEMLATAADAHLDEAANAYTGPHLIRQVAELVGALPEGIRQSFLTAALSRMSTGEDAGRKLESMAASAPAADMLASLRHLRDQGQSFSSHALEVIRALALEVSPSSAGRRELAADQLEEVMRTVLLDDPTQLRSGVDEFVLELPGLPSSPLEWSEELEEQRETLTNAAVTQSLLRTLLSLLDNLELDAVGAVSIAKRLEELFADLVLGGRPFVAGALIQHLRALAQQRDDMTGTGIRSLLHRLEGGATVDVIAQVVRAGEGDQTEQLQHLVEILGRPIVQGLLLTLGDLEDRRQRRRLYDFLKTQGSAAVTEARGFLTDDRWYVVRNMISLLREIPGAGSIPEVNGCLEHADPRVRLEAARFLISRVGEPDTGLIANMLDDPDPKVVSDFMSALGQARTRAAVPPLLAIVKQRQAFGKNREIRLAAIKTLGQIGDPSALPELRPCFSTSLMGRNVEERRAAYASLGGYPAAHRKHHLEQGLKSRDVRVQTICRQLASEDSSA